MEGINKDNYEAWLLDYAEGNLDEAQRIAVEAFLELHPHLKEELDGIAGATLPRDTHIPPTDWEILKQPTAEALRHDTDRREALYFEALEGQATEAEMNLLEQLLQDSTYRAEHGQWKRARMIPDQTPMADKDHLYRFGVELPIDETRFEDYLIALCEGQLSDEQTEALFHFAERHPHLKAQLPLAENLRLSPPLGVFYPDKQALYRKKEKGIFPLWILRAAVVALTLGVGISFWLSQEVTKEGQIAGKENPQKAPTTEADSSESKSLQIEREGGETQREENNQPLQEWEVLEPHGAAMAQKNGPASRPRSTVHDDGGPAARAQVSKLPMREAPELRSWAVGEPSLAAWSQKDALTEQMAMNTRENSSHVNFVKQAPIFYSIPQMATKSISRQLGMDESERDEFALALARRLTEKAGEALNAEVSKKTDPDSENLTYSLKIGGLKVSHSRSR